MRLLTSLIALAALAAAHKGRIPSGDWGGEHVRLSVTKDGATVEFDCARGTLEAIRLDADGRFDVKGEFAPEHGGPVRKDETTQGQAARYKGQLDGDSLSLEVVPEGGEAQGPFHLTRGGRGRLMKCR